MLICRGHLVIGCSLTTLEMVHNLRQYCHSLIVSHNLFCHVIACVVHLSRSEADLFEVRNSGSTHIQRSTRLSSWSSAECISALSLWNSFVPSYPASLGYSILPYSCTDWWCTALPWWMCVTGMCRPNGDSTSTAFIAKPPGGGCILLSALTASLRVRKRRWRRSKQVVWQVKRS